MEWQTIAELALKQGLLGCVCLAQALVIKRLYTDLSAARQETIDVLERSASLLERAHAGRTRSDD